MSGILSKNFKTVEDTGTEIIFSLLKTESYLDNNAEFFRYYSSLTTEQKTDVRLLIASGDLEGSDHYAYFTKLDIPTQNIIALPLGLILKDLKIGMNKAGIDYSYVRVVSIEEKVSLKDKKYFDFKVGYSYKELTDISDSLVSSKKKFLVQEKNKLDLSLQTSYEISKEDQEPLLDPGKIVFRLGAVSNPSLANLLTVEEGLEIFKEPIEKTKSFIEEPSTVFVDKALKEVLSKTQEFKNPKILMKEEKVSHFDKYEIVIRTEVELRLHESIKKEFDNYNLSAN